MSWVEKSRKINNRERGDAYSGLKSKYHEMKIGEVTLKIISCTKIQACSLKNIATGHFTYYCIALCLSNKPSFQI